MEEQSALNNIQFLLGNEAVEIHFDKNSTLQPDSNILDYLRENLGLKGSKEGCREGDCGACTAVIASVDINGQLSYEAVNTCLIFLPYLHGKQLISIEHLAQKKGNSIHLHPVQQILIDKFGSQCGFCTPGVIMSLFALYKSEKNINSEEICRRLSGNLCRCTGYKPIYDAAIEVLTLDDNDSFVADKEITIAKLNSISSGGIKIETSRLTYFRPTTFHDALTLRSQFINTSLAAGFTDLAHKILSGSESVPVLIDLSGIEHKQITENSEYWEIPASLNFNELRDQGWTIPMIKELTDVFASQQIRNLATIGGNVATASPVGDAIPVLMALDADVIVQSTDHERIIKIYDFITGYRTTQLMDTEIIQSIRINKNCLQRQHFFSKTSRRKDVDISCVSLAAGYELKEQKISKIRLYFGGMAATAKEAVKTMQALEGKNHTAKDLIITLKELRNDFLPLSDARSYKEGRYLMAEGLMMKFFESLQKAYSNE